VVGNVVGSELDGVPVGNSEGCEVVGMEVGSEDVGALVGDDEVGADVGIEKDGSMLGSFVGITSFRTVLPCRACVVSSQPFKSWQ